MPHHLLRRLATAPVAIARTRRKRSSAALHFTTGRASRREEPLGVCVVGAGRMGVIRAQAVYSNLDCRLASVVDTHSLDYAASFGSKFGCDGLSSLEEALYIDAQQRPSSSSSSSSVSPATAEPSDTPSNKPSTFDAVWIAAPTPSHMELIRMAAEAGKHVGVEKPITTDVEGIQEAYAVCAAAGVELYCSFQRRIDPSYTALASEVLGGRLGAVTSVRCTFRDHPTPEMDFLLQGGDIFTDLAVHDVDYVLWLLQEEPCHVFSIASSRNPELRRAGVADAAHALLTFPSGAVVSFELGRASAYGYDNRVEVLGDKGMLQIDNKHRTDVVASTAHGQRRDRPDHSFPERFGQAFEDEIADFVSVVRGEKAAPVDCLDCCKSAHVVAMMSASAREGRGLDIMSFAASQQQQQQEEEEEEEQAAARAAASR